MSRSVFEKFSKLARGGPTSRARRASTVVINQPTDLQSNEIEKRSRNAEAIRIQLYRGHLTAPTCVMRPVTYRGPYRAILRSHTQEPSAQVQLAAGAAVSAFTVWCRRPQLAPTPLSQRLSGTEPLSPLISSACASRPHCPHDCRSRTPRSGPIDESAQPMAPTPSAGSARCPFGHHSVPLLTR